jgi:hypothetical protein
VADGAGAGRDEEGVRRFVERFALDREAMILRWEQDLEDGIKAVGPHSPAGDRLEETRRFFAFYRGELDRVLRDWHDQRP